MGDELGISLLFCSAARTWSSDSRESIVEALSSFLTDGLHKRKLLVTLHVPRAQAYQSFFGEYNRSFGVSELWIQQFGISHNPTKKLNECITLNCWSLTWRWVMLLQLKFWRSEFQNINKNKFDLLRLDRPSRFPGGSGVWTVRSRSQTLKISNSSR